MQSRRDQVQAQTYVMGRLTSALVSGEPDTAENPHRRTVIGTVVGLLLAALVAGGVTIYGFLRPGGATAWQAAGTLIVEKDTGTRFVYLDGRLRPVINYASARLLFARPPTVVTVSAASLAGVPHGDPLGIPGAPDALPPASGGRAQVWTACAHAERDAAGTLLSATSLAVTAPAVALGGRELAADEGFAVVVSSQRYLVWQGRRLRIAEDWLPRVLGVDGPAFTAQTPWLDALPLGPDLRPVAVSDRGAAGPRVDGRDTRVGQLFVSRPGDGSERYHVLLRDGLADLTPLSFTIASGDPQTAALYPGGVVRAADLSPAALAGLPRSPAVTSDPALPAVLPRLVPAGAGPVRCVRQSAPGGRTSVLVGAPVSRWATASDAPGVVRTSRTATAVVVSPGTGGLVRSARPGQTGAAAGADLYLLTDAGVKYPVGGTDAAARLGYDAGSALAVSRVLLDLLPTGPLLVVPA